MSILFSLERLEQTVELFTKTPIIRRNYYSLYIDNPQVCCICAIFNRIIFFLFGGFGCFLGEAADQKGAISLKQEYALIENYNQAKKELLAALLAICQSSGDLSDTQKWKTAQDNYKKAVLQRSIQVWDFDFSTKACDEGLSVEFAVLLDARSLELIRIFDKYPSIPTSLFDKSTAETRLLCYPDLVEVRQKKTESRASPPEGISQN